MQAESLDLQQVRIGSLPIIRKFTNALSIKELLCEALHQSDYAEALETLTLSTLLRPDALYRVGQWANAFDDGLVRKGLSDDILGRALDRLFKADRSSLLTKLTLTEIDKFKIDTSQLYNDSTSVKFAGAYEKQHPKAVQLKRGHSKDHRPDLKQLVYSLSVTRDGAIPIHFKSYDGNQTDDKTHYELWQSLRGLLGRSDFLYVADSRLCVSETMRKIDREQRITVARGQLLHLNNIKRRGPKSETSMKKAIDKIISRYKIGDWLTGTITIEAAERFRQTRKGKATQSSLFKRSIAKIVRVDIHDNVDSQTRSAAMDGIRW